MPFTPYHCGLAVLIKSIFRKFSFLIFAGSQFLMDLEPLYFHLRGEGLAHRLFHTFLGCNIPALLAVLIGRPLCKLIFKIQIPLKTAVVSAFIGTYTHVLLDGLMHRDMQPFWPYVEGNPMLGYVYGKTIYDFCVICAVAAGIIFILKKLKEQPKFF